MTNNYAEYINANLNWLSNYLNHLADFDKQYRQAVYNLCNGKTDDVEKSDETLEYEQEIQEVHDNAKRLYNDLKLIAQKYKSRMNVKWDLESFHRRLTTTKLPIYERATLKMTTTEKFLEGKITGAAAMPTNPQKADFSEQAKFDLNMRTNMLLNRNNPDAQELANIFLGDPYKAPYSEEYKHLPAGSGKVLNSKYNLTKTNKEIKNYSEGFAYSRYSTLAKNVSNYADLRNQIKIYYNETTGKFNKDKIDVNFNLDQNLHRALGHATILEPTIKNGYFHGILFDIYDFDIEYYDYYNSAFITAANDYFWHLQEKYPYKVFYILAPVIFKW